VEGKKPRSEAGHPVEAPTTPERGGFVLKFDASALVLYARLWGFWDLEIAGRFRADLIVLGHRMGGKTWSMLVDSRTFLPQTPEVTGHRRDTMGMSLNAGCRRIAVMVTEKGTYAMQFSRIATEAGVTNAVFLDLALAEKWIREI
jgi:hypothetical protein